MCLWGYSEYYCKEKVNSDRTESILKSCYTSEIQIKQCIICSLKITFIYQVASFLSYYVGILTVKNDDETEERHHSKQDCYQASFKDWIMQKSIPNIFIKNWDGGKDPYKSTLI